MPLVHVFAICHYDPPQDISCFTFLEVTSVFHVRNSIAPSPLRNMEKLRLKIQAVAICFSQYNTVQYSTHFQVSTVQE